MMRRALLALPMAVAGVLASAGTAHASNGLESPDVGVVQIGRGGAWVVRADDPLAVFFNPAAIAWQRTSVHAGLHLMFEDRCFTRRGEDGKFVSASPSVPAAGEVADPPSQERGPNPEVCADSPAFPNPQIAGVLRLTDDLSIGFAIVGPHGVGNAAWPETVEYTNRFGVVNEQPAPSRFLLLEQKSVLFFPTVSVGYAITPDIAVGAGFIWGVADVEYSNFAEGISPDPGDDFDLHEELKAKLLATDAFIPGFVLGGLWAVSDRFEIGGWFKWLDAVDSDADIYVQSRYWDTNGKPDPTPCDTEAAVPEAADCNITDPEDRDGHLRFQIPMEAKLGLRYRHPRQAGRPAGRRVRDPMRDDLFDVEVDFTWANNSAVDKVELRFRGDPSVGGKEIPVEGTPGFVPSNADIPHQWRDVVGVRLGGDFVAIQDLLSLRAGGFFETKGQQDEYLNLDFHLGERIGFGGGVTVRLPLPIAPVVDVSAAYQHTIFGAIDNGGKGKIRALSGSVNTVPEPHRSRHTVNGGKLTNSLDEFGLAATVGF